MSDGLDARHAALRAIRAVDEEGAYSNLAVPDEIADLPEARDRGFAAHLAYGTLRWRGTLDWALGQVVSRPLEKTEAALLRILRMGAFQLLQTDNPPHAIVDTSVQLAAAAVPAGRAKGASGFVNGVLRNLARQRETLPWPDQATAEGLVLGTAHPRWIVDDAIERFGPDRARTLLHADNDPPGLTLRANGDRDALLAELQALGFEAQPGQLVSDAVRVPGADPRRLAAVAEGRAVPQDEASMFVVHQSGVQPGDRVLDLCAGPGGKATHLATIAGAGCVTAIELHPHRAELVRGAANRQGLGIDVITGDAREVELGDPFDVVLLDAPCTGFGTGRRRPEVRWRRRPEDVAALAEIQDQLLDTAVARTRPGGRLTYAVCTWTVAETVGTTQRLLARHPDRVSLIEERQLGPDSDATDGMYVATFVVGA